MHAINKSRFKRSHAIWCGISKNRNFPLVQRFYCWRNHWFPLRLSLTLGAQLEVTIFIFSVVITWIPHWSHIRFIILTCTRSEDEADYSSSSVNDAWVVHFLVKCLALPQFEGKRHSNEFENKRKFHWGPFQQTKNLSSHHFKKGL